MLKRLVLMLFFLIFFMSFPASVSASSWYVDNQANGSRNGTSWANAWNSLTNVVWGSNGIKSGDTLYISGGSVSKTYTESLNIPSGTTGVTITKGVETGHNGEVKINGGSGYGINVNTGANITIKNLTFTDSNGIYAKGVGSGTDGLIVDNCRFINFRRAGVFLDSGNRVVVKNSYFNDANEDQFTSQSDGIYAQLVNTFIADHNLIVLDNNYTVNPDLHSDNIQTYYVKNVTYSNNIVIQKSNKTLGTQMLFTEEGGQSDTDPNSTGLGIHTVVNNLFIRDCPNAQDAAIRLKNGKGTYFTPRVFNNTYYGRVGRLLNISTTLSGSLVLNNIFYYLVSGDTIPSLNSSNIIFKQGGGGDPKFINPNFDFPNGFDFRLSSDSPAIDKGTNLTSYGFTTDADNNPRGSLWDIGAYEYGGSTGNTPTITPKPTATSTPRPTSTPTLSPTPAIKPGDANGDNKVDGVDYTIWLNHYKPSVQQTGGNTIADFNKDNYVDGIDYTVWLSNYGK